MRRYETDRNYKNKLPKLIIENNNASRNDHFVSEQDRKVKNITLSNYNKYIKSYTKTLKHPSSNFYSTDKLKHFVSFNYLNNINLNKKPNFLTTFSEFNVNKQTGIFKTYLNNENNELVNKIKLINTANFESQDLIFYGTKYYKRMNDEQILKYFLEGTFLRKPEYLKYIGINEKNIHPHILNDNDLSFYSKYFENLSKNENITDFKTKNFEVSDIFNNNKLNFVLELKSICLHFEEININEDEKNIDIQNLKSEEINNYNYIDDINENKKSIHKLYLPFKYLPLIYILNFSNFKTFISEILSYDIENNQFKFIEKGKLEEIIESYSENCKKKLKTYKKDNTNQVLKNCLFYENEYHLNNEYYWFIFDKDKNNVTKVFKLKIQLPLITFEMSDLIIKFQRYLNKWLILELIKENFNSWDRYLLFNLFMNKKLRYSIAEIINKKEIKKYQKKIQFIGPIINGHISQKNNFDFFLTEMIPNNINYYYFVVPYQISITKKTDKKFEINDSVCLQLDNARKIYQLSKFFGLMGLFYKSMYYNRYQKKFYFSLKYLEGINNDYYSLMKNQKIQSDITNNEMMKKFICNKNEFYLIIKDCLLCKRHIDIMCNDELKYYKIPDNLYKFILENDDLNEKEIITNIINNVNDLTHLTEFEDKTISVEKSKSFKSLKSFRRKESYSFKYNYNQINSKNKLPKNKVTFFKEDKKAEKEEKDDLMALYKQKIHSFKNVRISLNKQK